MSRQNIVSTECVRINSVNYCVYCGSRSLSEMKWDGRDYEDIYYCNCDIAKDEVAMKAEIDEVKKKYNKVYPHNLFHYFIS